MSETQTSLGPKQARCAAKCSSIGGEVRRCLRDGKHRGFHKAAAFTGRHTFILWKSR